jgi:hypothetical protein
VPTNENVSLPALWQTGYHNFPANVSGACLARDMSRVWQEHRGAVEIAAIHDANRLHHAFLMRFRLLTSTELGRDITRRHFSARRFTGALDSARKTMIADLTRR